MTQNQAQTEQTLTETQTELNRIEVKHQLHEILLNLNADRIKSQKFKSPDNIKIAVICDCGHSLHLDSISVDTDNPNNENYYIDIYTQPCSECEAFVEDEQIKEYNGKCDSIEKDLLYLLCEKPKYFEKKDSLTLDDIRIALNNYFLQKKLE